MEKIKFDAKRSVSLFGSITNQSIGDLSTGMMKLYEEDKEKPIFLFINTSGGIASLAYGFYDTIRAFNIPLVTILFGKVSSSGLIIFLSAKSENRFITEHSLISPQKTKADYNENVAEVNIEESRIVEKFLKQILADETMIKTETKFREFIGKNSISPEECVELCIANYIEQLPKT